MAEKIKTIQDQILNLEETDFELIHEWILFKKAERDFDNDLEKVASLGAFDSLKNTYQAAKEKGELSWLK